MLIKSCLTLLATLTLVATLEARPEPALMAVNSEGQAADGYDVVAMVKSKTAQRGKPNIAVERDGATFLFESEENKAAFESNPEMFMPAFGGHCAHALCTGELHAGSPEQFQIIDGQLVLFGDKAAKEAFLKTREASLKTAQTQWGTLQSKRGKPNL